MTIAECSAYSAILKGVCGNMFVFANCRFTAHQACNSQCACSTDRKSYDPVCGSDDLTYFSACIAGCTDLVNDVSLSSLRTLCLLCSVAFQIQTCLFMFILSPFLTRAIRAYLYKQQLQWLCSNSKLFFIYCSILFLLNRLFRFTAFFAALMFLL